VFDIGFGELALVFVIGLVVLGPERLPSAVRTVVGWIRALRSLASTVQNELSQELKLQELQDSLKKVEKASKDNLTPELKASMDELREAADSMKRTFNSKLLIDEEAEPHTIHNPVLNESAATRNGVTPAEGAHQAEAPAMVPDAQSDSDSQPEGLRQAESPTPVQVSPSTAVSNGLAVDETAQDIARPVSPAVPAGQTQPTATAPGQHAASPTSTSDNDR